MIEQVLPFGLQGIAGFVVLGIYVALALLVMAPIIKKGDIKSNSFNKAFLTWLSVMLVLTLVRLVEYRTMIQAGVTDGIFMIGARLSTWHGLPMISIMTQLLFVLYIMRKSKYYSLPFIIMFFLALGLFQYDNLTAYNVVMIPAAYITAALFLWKGSKNRDGFTFAIGIFSLFDYGVPYFLYSPLRLVMNVEGPVLFLPFIGGSLFAIAFLNLGTWGWLDRHVFYDKERERRIKNAWVSQLIDIEKKKTETKKIAGKKLVIECPICHAQGIKEISREIILERARNEKGIVKMLLNQEQGMCEHQFVAYVDRSFSIRGYEPIDLLA